ncbi:zinc finger protein OZF-like isoform X2 [Synchiropus splendidus]|uniref:zinc finger protein OZF-like isoform X2 n=1 Tax=Synchiropus splendidus TaxID=270530 RepID=UPI00237DED51|nr:zinc finger protein OZF-like isoform X2 [Synchiropus splendidus]
MQTCAGAGNPPSTDGSAIRRVASWKQRAGLTTMEAKVKLEEDPPFSVEESKSRVPGGEAEEGGNILTPVDPSDPSHQLSNKEDHKSSSEDEDFSSPEERVKEDDPDYTPDCARVWKPRNDKKDCAGELSLSITQRKESHDKDEGHMSEDSASFTPQGNTAREDAVKPSPHDEHANPSDEAKCYQPLRFHKKVRKCHICGKVFRHNNHLRRHLLVHSGKKPFKCFICARGFTQRGNLKTHMKVHKGDVNWTLLEEKSDPKEAPVTANVCGDCGMDFPEPQQLEKHREIHRKPFSCPDCGKAFKCPKYLALHSSIHTGDSPFSCRTCAKRFLTADSLKKHELRHTGLKNFHCDQCGRSFSQSSNLQVHLQSHSGQRPHLCAVCGKSYSRAATLKVHLRVHTGETPYACDTCGKSFYYYQGYQKHLLVHNKKPKVQVKPLGRPKRNLSTQGFQ